MQDAFNPIEFLDYLRARWRVPASACALAAVLATAGSLMLPKRYTANAVIVIEPPGNDGRAASAVSPVYLESLKTYERFALSDSLFARATQRFHLQDASGAPTLESLKQRVLRVSKPHDTKILEIEVTLNEPKLAQSVVQFLAEETVELSRQENTAADREMLDQAEKQAVEAAHKLQEAQAASASFAVRAPVAAIQASVARSADSLATLRPAAVEAEAEAAGIEAQAKQGGDPFATERLPQMRARAAALNQRVEEMNRSIDANTALVSRWGAEKRNTDSDLTAAESAYQAAAARLRDARATAGMRVERLRVIDPGIVPQRPSFPNLPLNVIGATLLALIASLAYLSVAFGYRRKMPGLRPVITRERSA
jgi:uncharacterized protein involved in exopolysaccharide biosynthesis